MESKYLLSLWVNFTGLQQKTGAFISLLIAAVIFLTKRKELWSAIRSKVQGIVIMREWNKVRCAVPCACDVEFEEIFCLCKEIFKFFSVYTTLQHLLNLRILWRQNYNDFDREEVVRFAS